MTNRITKIILRGDIADLQAKMAVAAKSVGDTADKMTNASKESVKFRQGLTTLGTTAGKVGLVAAAGLGAAVLASARFDSAMSKVQAATHESASNMELLRAAAIKAGADTVFSATEAADAITALSKAGVSSGDILKGGLSGALSLASAGELDVASAAEIAATAMTQFGLAGKDIPHIADLLAAGAGKAQGEVSDMADALKYVGPVAHQMGISIEETAGTIAELASQGIIGEQAGTSLRGMLTSLTSPSALAAKTMKALGIELYDASGQFVGLQGVAGQLHDTMGNLTNAERDQALGRIFGNEQITAARILYAGGAADVAKWTTAVNDQGYAAETAAIKMDNLKGDLEQLKGSFETALIGLGEGDQGPLRDLVQTLTKAVNAFNDLPGPIKSATTGLLGIVAVTGGALWFGSKVIGGIANTRTALENLGPAGQKASANLGSIAGRAAGIIAVATAVQILGRALDGSVGNNVNTEHLNRELEALANGRGSDSLDAVADSLHGVEERGAGVANALFKIPGAIVGVRTSFQHNTDVISAFDEQLAQLVESGKADEAEQVFGRIAAAAKDQGVSVDETRSHFKQYQLALQNAADAALSTTGAAHLMSDAMTALINPTSKLGTAVKQNAADLEAQAKALAASRDAANKTAHEFFGLGKSVNNSKVSLHDWISDLQKQAKALRDFEKNAKSAAKNGLKEGLVKELEAAGPEGALRMQQLANASDKEIRRANRAWASGQRAIDAYTNAVGGVPPKAGTDLTVTGAGSAISAVQALKSLIDSLHDRNIHIKVTKTTNATLAEADVVGADGLTVPHAAAGWTVAGQREPYGDKVLAYLAPGEEVITNRHGEADQFRADRAAGRIPAYAAGSTAMPTPISVSVAGGSGIDYRQMATAARGDRLGSYRDSRSAHLDALRTALAEMPVVRVDRDLSLLQAVG